MRSGRPTKEAALALDWATIQMLWENGVTCSEISRRYPITYNAVKYRADKYKWDASRRDTSVAKRRGLPEGVEGIPERRPPPEIDMDTQAWHEVLLGCELGGMEALEDLAKALDNMAKGLPYGLSCEAAGLSERTVQGLRQRFPHLDAMFRKARAMAAKEAVAKIRDNQDWRAAAWLLERGIAKVEFQEAPQSKDDKLVVEIRINRDDKVALEGGVRMIDVTPEELPDAPMVPGIRALPEAEDLPRGQGEANPLRRGGGGR